jgi:manganese transport protein
MSKTEAASPALRWWEQPKGTQEEGPDQSFTEVQLDGVPWYRLLLKFIGPGVMIAIAYIDPGNYTTDLQGGSRFKYRLLWSVLLAHGLGYVFQVLTVKQTLATGRTLSEECGQEYSRVKVFLWLCGETASIASDLGYVMGTAIAFQILFNWPLIYGVLISVFDTFIFMAIQAMGHRKMELFCGVLGAVVVVCCVTEISESGMTWDMLTGLVPFWHGLSDGVDSTPISEDAKDYTFIVVGIIGASVVPPNFFLHSALTRTRRVAGQGQGSQEVCDQQMRTSVKWSAIETAIGIGFAFLINAIILVIAGKLYYDPTHPEQVDDLGDFSDMLAGALGSASKYIFALSIFAGGQSASVCGTLASQYIMEGFLNVRVKLWILRLATRTVSIAPAFFITWAYGNRSADIIDACQVVVNIVVPFTIIPILRITSSPMKMGVHANSRVTTAVLWVLCIFVCALNVLTIGQQILDSMSPGPAYVVMVAFLLPYIAICAYLIRKPVSIPPSKDGLVQASPLLAEA